MKLRRHKNTRHFVIAFFVIAFRTLSFSVVKNGGNVGGWEQRAPLLSRLQYLSVEGNSVGEVRRGFLFGRDKNNLKFIILPA